MPFMMQGAMMGMQAILGANQAGQQAAQQVTQQNWANHVQQMQTDQANRDKSEANAAQWMQNQLISEAAWTGMAEEQVYLRYNFNNDTGHLSRKSKQTYDALQSTLSHRNIKGGTAKALMRQQQDLDRRVFEARAITHGNQMRDTERKRDRMLSNRNFGYAKHDTFVPAANFTDPDSAYKSTLTSGLIKTGMGMYVGAQENQMLDAQKQMDQTMWKHYNLQLDPGWEETQLYGGNSWWKQLFQ